MRVLIDVNHPKDVHIFRILYFRLIEDGHDVRVTASRKPLTYELLEAYGIPFTKMGSYGSTSISKMVNLLWLDLRMLIYCIGWLPDVMIGHISFRVAHIGWLLRINNFCLSDTDSAPEQMRLYAPFAKHLVTPRSFRVSYGDRHIRFDGYNELAYLHPEIFKPDWAVLLSSGLSLDPEESFFVLRFVAWNATHDRGMRGFSEQGKRRLVELLRPHGRVFITSETAVPEGLESYILDFPVHHIHHLLAFAKMVIGESATMSTEAACLGVPSIYIDHQGTAYSHEIEEKYGLIHNFTPEEEEAALGKVEEILSMDIEIHLRAHKRLLHESVNLSDFQRKLVLGCQ